MVQIALAVTRASKKSTLNVSSIDKNRSGACIFVFLDNEIT